eukprot:2784992-Pyramimonas_sp.AAC.1
MRRNGRMMRRLWPPIHSSSSLPSPPLRPPPPPPPSPPHSPYPSPSRPPFLHPEVLDDLAGNPQVGHPGRLLLVLLDGVLVVLDRGGLDP